MSYASETDELAHIYEEIYGFMMVISTFPRHEVAGTVRRITDKLMQDTEGEDSDESERQMAESLCI